MAVSTVRDLTLSEREQADRLAKAASTLGASAVHSTTLTAATAVLKVLSRRDDTVAKRAAALKALRTDYKLATALSLDVITAGRQARSLLVESLAAGYRMDLVGRSRILEAQSTGLTLTIDVTAADLATLRGYPILGHSADDIASHLAARLRFELDGALGQALGGLVDPSAVAAVIGKAALSHGNRVADAVREAFFAGVQAAMRALGKALLGNR